MHKSQLATALAVLISVGALGIGAAAQAQVQAQVQDYPNRPITLVVPFAAGGRSSTLSTRKPQPSGMATG